MQYFDVTLDFLVGLSRVRPKIKHIPALDAEDAERKALATSTAKVARASGHDVTVFRTEVSTE